MWNLALRENRRKLRGLEVSMAFSATHRVDGAVDFIHFAGARFLMQPVDILGDDGGENAFFSEFLTIFSICRMK